MPGTFLASGHGVDARIRITIAQGYKLSAGTVLGKITASGKYGPYSASATDGRQTAVGILMDWLSGWQVMSLPRSQRY